LLFSMPTKRAEMPFLLKLDRKPRSIYQPTARASIWIESNSDPNY